MKRLRGLECYMSQRGIRSSSPPLGHNSLKQNMYNINRRLSLVTQKRMIQWYFKRVLRIIQRNVRPENKLKVKYLMKTQVDRSARFVSETFITVYFVVLFRPVLSKHHITVLIVGDAWPLILLRLHVPHGINNACCRMLSPKSGQLLYVPLP